MKRIVTALLLLFSTFSALHAQIITTDPNFPTPGQPVTIYFDASEGTGGLKDFTGDVFAHTGVITDQSTDGSDWKHVIAAWDENIPKAKMERVEANRYKLSITPSIREFYNVPNDEKIEKIAFVFRSSEGSKDGKAEGGADIYVDVYQSNFTVKFIQPDEDSTFSASSNPLSIVGISSSANTELHLLMNDQQIAQSTGDTLRYTFTPSAPGDVNFSLIGTKASESDTARTHVIFYPPTPDENRPAGLKDGITYIDDSTVELSLFAPNKNFVYLLGDFNDWQAQPKYFMHRDEVNADSTYYWIKLTGLTPGKEYAFQYLVDGNIRVTDPYVHKILDPEYDDEIPSNIYPNLKPYPAGKTTKIVGVLQPGKADYNWQNNNFDRPDKKNLVIYELLVRDFLKQHDYATLTDTLDYLDRLGVNVVELMPVMEFQGNSSWGYNPTFHLATDKYYGPANDLKKFIDACHAKNIAVVLDIVLNHAYGPSPLVRLWNEGDYGKPTPENPYLNVESPNLTFNFGYDFNHESAATQYFVDRVNRYWLNEFHADGFRFDFTKGFTQKSGDGSAYDASRIHILERMANQIWATDDSAYVILEHFANNEEEKELSSDGMMLWGNLNGKYNEATMGYNQNDNSNFASVSYQNRGWDDPHLVGYMESHDEERIMFKNLQYGNSNPSGSYDITDLATALNRIKMAGAFFFTVPGPKMIWQFGELGYDISIDENGRTGEKPLKWSYYSNQDRKRLYNTFQALIRLRNSDAAFTSDESEITMDTDGDIKRITIDHPDMKVSVIGNFGVNSGSGQPAFAKSGDWYEFFSGDTLHVADTDMTIKLDAGEFHIYTTKKFEKPDDIFAGSDDDGSNDEDQPSPFSVSQNYPNPFNGSTTIPYTLENKAHVTLEIYNILGQEVQTIDRGEVEAGHNEIPIDASSLASGLYIYQLRAGDHVSSKKMLLIK